MHNVLIGIQARSTSERLPEKCFKMIGDKMMLEHVLDSCKSAASYLNRHTAKTGVAVKVALLVPFRDPIEVKFARKSQIIQGPEHDVLSRYKSAADMTESDYIVRITGDCPLIPAWVISKHIKIAMLNSYDYLSNGNEGIRTSLDGIDCEVISKKLLDYIDDIACEPPDREHVTLMARRDPPSWARMGFVGGSFDFSNIKLSVDTEDDLERVRDEYRRVTEKNSAAERKYGRQSVHRI